MALVTKLRAILLMEANFNIRNRLIFGNRMVKLARETAWYQRKSIAKK